MKRDVVILVALTVALTACLTPACSPKATGITGQEPIPPVPSKDQIELVLYFGDDQAMEVWPERRVVEIASDPSQRIPVEQLVVGELIKGPTDDLLSKTIPHETEVLSLQVTDGLALVNFSKELQTKHWGGSAGEIMTIKSLVYSLTELPNITQVQILVQGKTVDTLAGHYEIIEPLSRRVEPGNVFTGEQRASAIQSRVENGEELWRLDPLEVAKREAPGRGLLSNLKYVLVSQENSEAVVEVEMMGETYVLSLFQPQAKGSLGVWVILNVSCR